MREARSQSQSQGHLDILIGQSILQKKREEHLCIFYKFDGQFPGAQDSLRMEVVTMIGLLLDINHFESPASKAELDALSFNKTLCGFNSNDTDCSSMEIESNQVFQDVTINLHFVQGSSYEDQLFSLCNDADEYNFLANCGMSLPADLLKDVLVEFRKRMLLEGILLETRSHDSHSISTKCLMTVLMNSQHSYKQKRCGCRIFLKKLLTFWKRKPVQADMVLESSDSTLSSYCSNYRENTHQEKLSCFNKSEEIMQVPKKQSWLREHQRIKNLFSLK